MKYRSRTDIIAEMLEIAKEETTKTKIMYKAYLSYTQLKEYLTVLVEHGMLHESETGFKTTKKGLEFLTAYCVLGSFVEPKAQAVKVTA